MMRLSAQTIALWLLSTGILLSWDSAVRAQSFGFASSETGFSRTPSFSYSGVGSYFSGSSAYVPFSAMGGFVPYSPGPGGGVGVQPGMRSPGSLMQTGAMSPMGMSPSLGAVRSQITPLTPISSRGMGTGMGSMGGLIRRMPVGGSMGGMARPPVGSYPFRQPPSLLGPATSASAMSM
jgi:hypothetical protein